MVFRIVDDYYCCCEGGSDCSCDRLHIILIARTIIFQSI